METYLGGFSHFLEHSNFRVEATYWLQRWFTPIHMAKWQCMPIMNEEVFSSYIFCVSWFQFRIIHATIHPWNSSIELCFFLHLAEFIPPFQCYIACVMMCSHGNIVPNEMTPSLLFAKYYTEIYAQIGSNTSFTFNKIVTSPPR